MIDVILSESDGSAVVLDCAKIKSRSFVPQDDTFRAVLRICSVTFSVYTTKRLTITAGLVLQHILNIGKELSYGTETLGTVDRFYTGNDNGGDFLRRRKTEDKTLSSLLDECGYQQPEHPRHVC
jgi:hypothetical protein